LAINIPGAKLKMDDKKLNYRIFKLQHALNPGDSLAIDIQFVKQSRGFENEISFLSLTHNGTFFNNTDIVPQIGYVSAYEINDKNKRKELKLPPKKRSIKLDENNMAARANTYISHCSDWVEVKSTVSTSSGQIAIAPGSLRRKWTSNGRNYFQYQLDQKSLDFYSFLSGEYQVARKKFKETDLEVYYIKEHAYNVPNMLLSMEKSLEYYTTNFGKYYHKQCRIIEFPRYAGFAQAFPGTMPYSESIGFIADLRDISQDDIDLVFYVVAHEMGHQYWAHQLCGAEMQGSEWMSEGFAQYSALMVMEKEYGRDKMNRFLKYEMDKYLQARGKETEAEQALYKTESQPYIHYQKASIAMYYLKELIGENKVNEALKSLIDTFAYKPPPYPTSLHALRAVRRMTPDSLQYAVNDLFENIILFSNRLLEAKSRKVENGYEVTLICSSEKFRADSLGNEKEIGINDYIDIACFGKPEGNNKLGKKIFWERRIINRENNTLVFRTAEEPFMAGIDPYNYLIDRVPDDNLKRVSEN
jgi:aminopeptidase N